MIVVFDEIFNDLTFNIRQVTLQDAIIAYTLTGNSGLVINDTSPAIVITLREDDVSQIKCERLLVTELVNTERLVADLSNNRAIACANGINPLQVSFFEDNLTPPQFLSFNVFILVTSTLSVDEPVDTVNVNYTLIILMNQANGGYSITLTGGQAVSDRS